MAFWRNSLLTGAIASLGTTVALALLGKSEKKGTAAPINAISHILWGDEAFEIDETDLKHTLAGGVLNAGSVAAWAAVQELALKNKKDVQALQAIATSAAVTGLAYLVDYHVVPKRLTPGFEERLSKRSLAGVYGVLAACLAVGALLREE